MKKYLLSLCLLIATNAALSQSLDKLMAAPARPAQGEVAGGIGNSRSNADTELNRRVENQKAIDSSNRELSDRVDAGKKCKADCYKIERTSSDSISVRCMIGAKAGSSETVWKYKSGGYGYSPNGLLGAQYKSFDEAARFVCGQ